MHVLGNVPLMIADDRRFSLCADRPLLRNTVAISEALQIHQSNNHEISERFYFQKRPKLVSPQTRR